MSRSSRHSVLLLFLLMASVGSARILSGYPLQEHAQPEHSAGSEAGAQHQEAAAGEHASSQEHAAGGEEHSGTESHEPNPIYRWINFAILVGGLIYVLRKPLSEFFSERTGSIRRSLEDGRSALAAADEKLKAVEQKLEGFETEMAAFRAAALKEMEDEHARLRKATEQEAEKMMESVRVQMEVAGRQSRLELRIYATEQAIELAEKVIAGRMDAERQRRLVSQFVEKLGA